MNQFSGLQLHWNMCGMDKVSTVIIKRIENDLVKVSVSVFI